MLIDDVKGALAALKTEMQEDRRIKSGADLNVGDIVYQNMDRSDGLVLNKGYDDRLKYFVIVDKRQPLGLCTVVSNEGEKERADGFRGFMLDDGTYVQHPHWTQLIKSHWAQVYKTTGTPCSCPLCQGESYSRLAYEHETKRIIEESEM